MPDRPLPSHLSYVQGALPSTPAVAPTGDAIAKDARSDLAAYQQAGRTETPVDPALANLSAAPGQGGFGTRMRRGLARFLLGSTVDQPWFGAGQPLAPVAQEAAKGRQFDFPTNINIVTRPRASEPVTFEQLRGIADNYDLLRIVIETRKDQLEKLDWSIQLKADDNRQRPAPDKRCKGIAKFFRKPDKVNRWGTWLRAVLEDLLVIDAPALYAQRDRAGRLYALQLVDGATIKRLIDQNTGRAPGPDEPAYQQILHGMQAVDYRRPGASNEPADEKIVKYLRPQRETGNIRKADDGSGLPLPELIYAPRNVRTHKLYGFSPVEQILMTVNIGLRHQSGQLQYFTAGNVPDAFMTVPTGWTPDQIAAAQAYWDSITLGQQQQKRQLRFVPDGKYIPTREAQLKGEFDEWLARVICFAFSISPTAFIRQVNRATAESQKQQALEEGLVPWMKWIKDLVDEIIETYWGFDDVEFVWDDSKDVDPATKATIDVAYVGAGVLTKDEVRSDLGLAPLEQPDEPQHPQGPTDELGNPLGPDGRPLPPSHRMGANGGPPMGPEDGDDAGGAFGKAFFKSFTQPSGPTTGLQSYALDSKPKRLFPRLRAGWLRRRYVTRAPADDATIEKATAGLAEAIRSMRAPPDPFDAAAGQGRPVAIEGPIAKADSRDPLDRIAAAHEDNLAARLAGAMQQVGQAANDSRPEGQQVLQMVPARAEVETRIARALDPLLRIFNLGGRQASNDNPPITPGDRTVSFRFDMQNPATVQAAQDLRIKLAGELTDDAMARIQEAVSAGAARGEAPAAIARQIRDVVGLTEGQAAALEKYRAELQSGDRGALGRALRDQRFDGVVQRAIDGEAALTDEQVDRITSRYGDRLRAHRAMTIARTESLRAANQGAREAMRQAAGRGEFGNRAVRRFWMTAPGCCPICAAIAEQNPDGVGLDEPFRYSTEKGSGEVAGAPAHPSCRCTETFKTVPGSLEDSEPLEAASDDESST